MNANNQVSGGDVLADSVNSYTWNAEGKLASVGNASGSTTYSYDGDGRRVMKKTAGKLYWYGTDGNVLAESDASGNITDEYIFFGGRRIARRDSSGNVDYYLADQLGSARVVTNSSGSILDDCDFLPFGDEGCVSSSSGNIYKFTGKERDSESGNDYFGARYYTDTLGRFLSPDPGNAGSDPSNPQSWNGYSYARNDPATATDPTGLASCSQDSAGGWHGGAGCWDAGPSGESNREAANASAAALLGQRAQQRKIGPQYRPPGGSETVSVIAGIICGETCGESDSSKESESLASARDKIAHVRLNGIERWGANVGKHASMAPPVMHGAKAMLPIVEGAVREMLNGVDPTHGAILYNMRTAAQVKAGHDFWGYKVHTVSGPYNTPSKYKYIVTYGP